MGYDSRCFSSYVVFPVVLAQKKRVKERQREKKREGQEEGVILGSSNLQTGLFIAPTGAGFTRSPITEIYGPPLPSPLFPLLPLAGLSYSAGPHFFRVSCAPSSFSLSFSLRLSSSLFAFLSLSLFLPPRVFCLLFLVRATPLRGVYAFVIERRNCSARSRKELTPIN